MVNPGIMTEREDGTVSYTPEHISENRAIKILSRNLEHVDLDICAMEKEIEHSVSVLQEQYEELGKLRTEKEDLENALEKLKSTQK